MKKSRLVLWANKGSEETGIEKSLITLELQPENNRIVRNILSAEDSTEDLALALITKWKKGETIEIPTPATQEEIELSASLTLVPEPYEAIDTDLVLRTQTEWIFIVLSTKLYQSYQNELEELKEQINKLEKYSKSNWDAMKNFWSKVQNQIKEHNLFREHSQALKSEVNHLFDFLKNLRSAEDAAFETESAKNVADFLEILEPIEKAIDEEGTDLQKLFNKLKKVQNDFKKIKITRSSRTELWERIDKAFKAIKEKRSPGSSNNSADKRLSRRIEGLESAINKMQTSINRDQKELDIQERKLNDSNVGQLETQLREVKAKLIKERITSKTRKLDDMHKTLKELNTRLEKIVAKQAKEEKARAEKEAAAKKAAAEAAEKAAQEASVEKAAPVVEEVIPVSKPTVLGADEEEELGEIIAEVKTKEEEE